MKKLIMILIMAAFGWFGFNSCKKTGGSINPLTDVKNNGIGSYLVLDSTLGQTFGSPIATSTIGIITHAYAGGEEVDHTVLYSALGSTYDTTKWHMVKSVPYSKDNKLAVTGAELGAAFGVDPSTFEPGSFYTVYTRVVTKSGKTYDVNNTGDNSGSGLINGPFYYSAFSFTGYIGCAFSGSIGGKYTVVTDDWADNPIGGTVMVTDGPGPNQINLSQVWPGSLSGGATVIQPLLVNVNPTTGEATVPKVDFGDYGGVTTSSGGGSGYVLSCTGLITLSIDVIYGGGDQGNLRLVLQKQ
ncbi:hypothetical protein ACX0G9_29380 [Flavitalea flava]